MRSIRLLAILTLVALGLVNSDATARMGDIEVRTLDGASVPLSTYFEPDKWTVVMLWTTYCGTCRSQYPVVSAFHDKHRDVDAKVVGLSLDGYAQTAKVRAYIASKPMTFDSAVVDVDSISIAYKTITEETFLGTPTYLLFDPDGALVAQAPGILAVESVENFIRNGQ